ncbi:MAG: hypothetical protein AAF968_09950 [Pseudomonadota bacterium]
MTEWDPYYLARGLRRRLPDAFRQGALARERQERSTASRNDAEAADRELTDAAMTAVIEQERIELQKRLVALEAANAAALLENAEALEETRMQLLTLLDSAFTLPDGRRVFRTEDGTRVVDEHGQDVEATVVSPDAIEDHRPTWEEYRAARDAEAALQEERERLIEQQARLDDARNRFDENTLSTDDLDALDAEFGPPQNQTATHPVATGPTTAPGTGSAPPPPEWSTLQR